MKSILVPTDFSENSKNALRYALYMAQGIQANVTILNAYQIPYAANSMRSDKIFEVLEEGSQTGLDEIKEEFDDQYPEVKIFTKTYRGDLRNYVSVDKNMADYDMIVMGTKGASSLDNVIFGSTTTTILNKSSIPVLAVPFDANYEDVASIAYASDYQKEDLEIINKLVDIAQSFDADIKVVHIVEEGFDDFEESVRFEGFKAVVKQTVNFDRIIFEKVVANDFDQGLKDYVAHKSVSLLAMTTHKRSFLAKLLVPSLTKMITMHAEVPVISFRVD